MSELTDPPDDIAIIGMACRFPGAGDYEAFWRAQRDGRFCVGEVPADRWRWQQYYSTRREDENKTISKWGGFMADIDQFDAALFRISPREAELMDPQQRIMLELAWSCFEDAGYAPASLRGSNTGVYLGVCNFDYKMQVERAPAAIEAHMSTGVHTTLIPNRVSYEFDLRGPSIPFDTACSSSLVALAEAVHALRRGDCGAALVGGVSVLLNPTHFISFSKAGMLSPRGVCRSFDEGADGYVRGEGAGLIMLKPLHQALRDGDKVYGLVKGVAVNHGGKVATVTSPNPFAQARCVEMALRDAALTPAAIGYIEAHGTGTPKGDPIEMNALIRAYASQARAQGVELAARSCAIGSVKTSIGHLEAAAGIAGIIKVLMAFRHGTLPGIPGFAGPHANLAAAAGRFAFSAEPQPWPAPVDRHGVTEPRRAAINNFGFSGVNAHLVLEEYLPAARQELPAQPELIVLSARTDAALRQSAIDLLQVLEDGPVPALSDVAFTLQTGRAPFNRRLAVVADSHETLRRELQRHLDGNAANTGANATNDATMTTTGRAGAKVADRAQAELWAGQGHLPELARHWVDGGIVDWRLLRAEGSARRVALPGHPLSPRPYWVAGATGLSALHGRRKAKRAARINKGINQGVNQGVNQGADGQGAGLATATSTAPAT